MKQWIGIFGSMLVLLPLGCIEQSSVQCYGRFFIDPIYSGKVTREQCTGLGEGPSTIIRISRDRPHSELWVLEDLDGEHTATPSTPIGVGIPGRHLNDWAMQARSQAVVQMNGFTFSCDPADPYSENSWCYWWGLEYPVTTVFESTKMLSRKTIDDRWGREHILSFGPRGSAQSLIQLIDTGGAPVGEDAGYYNAVGSVYPLLLPTGCFGRDPMDTTVIGYSAEEIIMLYAPQADFMQICNLLFENNVQGAVLMDGSYSAGMYTRDGWNIGHAGQEPFVGRNIPYTIGLVTLDEWNRVDNGGFEDPDLSRRPGGTPPGFHSYSGEAIQRDVQWDGAMFLYNTPLYHEWVRGHPQSQKTILPSRGAQIAAIRTRGDDTNHITQYLDVPDNRYCMLHFYHGYHKPNGCNEPASKLTVTAAPCFPDAPPYSTAEYSSGPTHGSNPDLLHEVWLRLLTPSTGTCMKLSFTASRPRPDETAGNCEVLLDDVSVSCAR